MFRLFQFTRRTPLLNRFTWTLCLGLVDMSELRCPALDIWPLFSSRASWAFPSALEEDYGISGDLEYTIPNEGVGND